MRFRATSQTSVGVFTFKQFSVVDERSTMKVGTDAVLLGAWAPVAMASTILDVGTGSGVIALMIAQRSFPNVSIDAVELQEEDAWQAAENVSASPWPLKIKVIHSGIQHYRPDKRYDLIVCNPPYFSNGLLPPSEARSTARHQTNLSPSVLLDAVIHLLSPAGKFCLILPSSESQEFIHMSASRLLFLQHLTRFYSRQGKPQERTLMEFGFESCTPIDDALTLYGSDHQWSDDYRRLTKDFYLER